MTLVSFASRTAAALVAAVAGFASYRHIVDVADAVGERHTVALALPLAIDGLIVVATLAMVEDNRAGRSPRTSARFALGFGVLATLAANIASAEPSWTARAVAAVPAVSFLIAVEVLARRGRRLSEPVTADGSQAHEPVREPVAEPVPGPVREPAHEPLAPAHRPATVTTPEPLSEPVREPVQAPARKRLTAPSLTAAQRVIAAHTQHPDATHTRLAELAKVSLATVKRHRPTGSPSGQPPAETTPINGSTPQLTEARL